MSYIQTKSFKLAVYQKNDPDAQKLAIVIPGRLDSKDYIHMTSLVDDLADNGYIALSFDPPGTWDSPYSITDYTTTNTQKAIKELVDHFNRIPTVLVGHSRGGSNAMLAATLNPEVTHFAAIMSQAGASSLGLPEAPEGVYVSFRDIPPGMHRTKERIKFVLPYSYFIDQNKYDASTGLRHSSQKKLFFYGTQDKLVLEKNIKTTFENSAEPKQIHELDTEHDYRLHPHIIKEVNNVVINFFNG